MMNQCMILLILLAQSLMVCCMIGNNPKGRQDEVRITTTHRKSEPCDGNGPMVIDDDHCPVDGILWHGNCYLISSFKTCRKSAENYCAARGFDLVSIETKQENYLLMWLLQENSDKEMYHKMWEKPDAYWTSGVYMKTHNTWVWTAIERALSYEGWCANQPNASLTMDLACPYKRKMKMMKNYYKMKSMWKGDNYKMKDHHRSKRYARGERRYNRDRYNREDYSEEYDDDDEEEDRYGSSGSDSDEDSDEMDYYGSESSEYDNDSEEYNAQRYNKYGGGRGRPSRHHERSDRKRPHGRKGQKPERRDQGRHKPGKHPYNHNKGYYSDNKKQKYEEDYSGDEEYYPGESKDYYNNNWPRYDMSDAYLVVGNFNHSMAWFSMPKTGKIKNYFICEKSVTGRNRNTENKEHQEGRPKGTGYPEPEYHENVTSAPHKYNNKS